MTEIQVSAAEIDGRFTALATQRNDALNHNAFLAGKINELQHLLAARAKELAEAKAQIEELRSVK